MLPFSEVILLTGTAFCLFNHLPPIPWMGFLLEKVEEGNQGKLSSAGQQLLKKRW